MKRIIIAILVTFCVYSGTALSSFYSSAMNIASESDLPAGLIDGERGCACVKNASFGSGLNPGEIIEANFYEKKNIKAVGLYLGCSVEHGEVGSGYIEAKVNGYYKKVEEFTDFGYVTYRFIVEFSEVVTTDSLKIHITDGGGPDKNLCISEIEIYQDDNSDRYNQGFEDGKQYCINNPSACGISLSCSQSVLERAKQEGYEEAKEYCQKNPRDCGINIEKTGECPTCNCNSTSNLCEASFNIFTNTLHVPCLNIDKSYWLDLKLINSDPVQLELKGFGEN